MLGAEGTGREEDAIAILSKFPRASIMQSELRILGFSI
jgi:hypothetical protein